MSGMSVMAVGRRCSGWWSAVWSGWVAVLLLVGVCLALAPPADADEWVQVTCTAPDGAPAPVEGWQGGPYGVAVADSGPIDTCDQHGGALTAYDSSAVQAPAYTGAIWVYTASAGSTIAGGVLSVSLSTPQGQAFVATPQDAYNAANVVINCQYNEPCGADGTETASVSIAPTFAGGSQLFAAAMCVSPTYGGTTCPAGSGGGTNATISVYSADIELQNSATPTGAGFAGTLLSPGASGTAELTFTAQDHEGPGVYRVIVESRRRAGLRGHSGNERWQVREHRYERERYQRVPVCPAVQAGRGGRCAYGNDQVRGRSAPVEGHGSGRRREHRRGL